MTVTPEILHPSVRLSLGDWPQVDAKALPEADRAVFQLRSGAVEAYAVKSSKSENVLKFPICGKSTTYGDFLLACYRLARLHKSNKDGNIRHFVVMSKILC